MSPQNHSKRISPKNPPKNRSSQKISPNDPPISRDFIPPNKTAYVAGMYAAMTGLGRILGFAYQYLDIATEVSYTFLTTAGVSVFIFAIYMYVLKEPEATEGSVKYLQYKSGRKGHSAWNDAYAGYLAPLVNKDFAIIAAARVFYYMHFAGESMLLFYYRDGLGLKQTDSRALLAAMGLVTCASYILLAPLVGWMTRTVEFLGLGFFFAFGELILVPF